MRIEPSDIASFNGKVVLVTGGSSGIGYAAAQLLASKGAKVVIGDLQLPKDSVASGIDFVKTDAGSWSSQLNLFKETIQRHGKLDVALVNAGIAEGEQAFEDRVDAKTGDPIEPNWSTLKVNLIGGLITTKLALHFLRKSPSGGAIVLSGSRASYDGYNMPVYAASKHGLLGMMRALRAHTPAWNIRINLIAPSVTFTSLLPSETRQHYERLGLYCQSPEDVARAVAYLVQDSTLHGKAISISQGVYRELEEPLANLKDEIYGKDDFNPSNGDEFHAMASAMISRF